jgi:chromosome segregation ATPase
MDQTKLLYKIKKYNKIKTLNGGNNFINYKLNKYKNLLGGLTPEEIESVSADIKRFITDSKQDILSYNTKFEDITSNQELLRQKIIELLDKLRKCNQEKEDCNRKLVLLITEKETLEEKISEMIKSNGIYIQQLKQYKTLEQEKRYLEERLREKEEIIKTLTIERDDLNKQLKDMKDTNQKFIEKLSQYTTIETDKSRLQEEVSKLTEQINQLTSERDRINNDLDIAQQNIQQLSREKNLCEQRLRDLQAELERLKTSTTSEIMTLKTQLRSKEQEIDNLKKIIGEKETEIFTLNERIAELETRTISRTISTKGISTQTEAPVLPLSPLLRQDTFTLDLAYNEAELKENLGKINKEIKEMDAFNIDNFNRIKLKIIKLIQDNPTSLGNDTIKELFEDTIVLLFAMFLILTSGKLAADRTASQFNIHDLLLLLPDRMINNIKRKLNTRKNESVITQKLGKRTFDYDKSKFDNYDPYKSQRWTLVGGIDNNAIKMLNYKNNL